MTGPIIDMTPNGHFAAPKGSPIATQILRLAVLVVVLGGALAMAAFALWVVLLLVPIVLGAALVGWLAWRWRLHQLRAAYSAANASTEVASRAASANRL